MHVLVRIGVAGLLSFSIHASATDRVCIGGDLDHLSEVQKSACWSSARQVHANADKFKAPDDWHFYVICSEADWKAFAMYSKTSPKLLAAAAADTDLGKRTTFFRGEWLVRADEAYVQKTVAHEVAVARLESTDEKRVQIQIAKWIPQTGSRALTLWASR